MSANLPKGFKVVSYIKVSYNDLERLIHDHYGHAFEFAADQECGNDSDKAFSIDNKALDDYDQKRLDQWKATGRGSYLAQIILSDLCRQGIIPEGDYIVSVSW